MNSKTIIVHLLLVFSLFVSCLPAPKFLLVETDGGGAADKEEAEGGKVEGGKAEGGEGGVADYQW